MLASLVAAHTALASPFGLRRASPPPLRSRVTRLGLDDVRASLLAEVAAVPNRGAALNRTLASLLAAGYIGRTIIYRRIADESAELGQQVLKANVENLTVTLKAVAANGETVDALVALLLELLAAETTRKALVDLLCAAYQDAGLQHKTGVFALEALDTDDARDMLDVQVQRLVSAAVLDDQVQRDTGVGVRAAIKRAVLGG